MTKPVRTPDVAFNAKVYFDNYHGPGLSYFDQPFDLSYEAEDLRQAMALFPRANFKSFLDLGAADGRAILHTKKSFTFSRMDGIELSKDAVDRALPGCNIVHGDVLAVVRNIVRGVYKGKFKGTDRKQTVLAQKYSVILASLLMYFDEKPLRQLLAQLPSLCTPTTLLMFPFDPDQGKHHGFKNGKYVKYEPNAFVSLYRPLGWWHNLLALAGFEIVYYKDPTCPIYRYNPKGAKYQSLCYNDSDTIGNSGRVFIWYVDNKAHGAVQAKLADSSIRVKSGNVELLLTLKSEKDNDGNDVQVWEAISPVTNAIGKNMQHYANIRAAVKNMALGNGTLRFTTSNKFNYIPGFYPFFNKKLGVWTHETDFML